MLPLAISAVFAFLRWGRICRIAIQPTFDYVMIELLGPQHAGETLAHHVLGVGRENARNNGGVEFICFAMTKCHDVIEISERTLVLEIGFRQTQADKLRLTGLNQKLVVSGCFGSLTRGVY